MTSGRILHDGPMSIRAEFRALRPRASWGQRVGRVRERSSRLLTSAVGAALAWWVAHDLLGHAQPFFAPVTVLVTLGLTYGQRLRRVAELVAGVTIGVLIGDTFVYVFGSGVWQIAVVAAIAMLTATFLGVGPLLSVQAGVQGVIVTTLVAQPDQAFLRWTDALIGGAVALILSTLVPATPVRQPRHQAAQFIDEIGEIMREVSAALRSRDDLAASRALQRARQTESGLQALREATKEGLEVAAISPIHFRRREGLRAITSIITPLDRCVRNLRVVARRAGVAIRSGEEVPDSYLDMLDALANVTTEMGESTGDRLVSEEAESALNAIADDTRHKDPEASLSAELMRAQIRSMCVDLLMLTGHTHDEASTDLIPKVDP